MRRRLLATITLVGCCPTTQALSNADIASVFSPTATDLTGSSTMLPMFVLSVVANSSELFPTHRTGMGAGADWFDTAHALVSMNASTTKMSAMGWMASGVGTVSRVLGSLSQVLMWHERSWETQICS